uniref:Uncharacterized protein n=1 Tax=Nelumbo nucifera TaxID=4432 RepID=A0A822YHT4_NELNU|nr:TPA_asm: hypothetical protein HUJ06_030486 [Nelumbo nucifera]
MRSVLLCLVLWLHILARHLETHAQIYCGTRRHLGSVSALEMANTYL